MHQPLFHRQLMYQTTQNDDDLIYSLIESVWTHSLPAAKVKGLESDVVV